MERLPATFTNNMNKSLAKDITENELSSAIMSMAKGKAPGHDGILVELFQKLWSSLGQDFLSHDIQGHGKWCTNTKGLISFIPKEGDAKDLNYWRPITLLTTVYKIFAKTL